MDFEDNNPLGMGDLLDSRSVSPELAELVPAPEPAGGHGRIVISEASKSREGSSRGHITYTIRLPSGTSVRRRYSEFESLRKLLRRLFPCVVVPPIPEKHSLGAYATNPAHAHEDARIIEHRQRTLADFLNRCSAIPQIEGSWVLTRFLDPNSSWREVLQSEFIQKLPASPFQAPPVDPTAASPAHAYLPIPSGSARRQGSTATKNSGNSKDGSAVPAGQSSDFKTGTGDGLADGPGDGPGDGTVDGSFEASEQAAREYENVIGSGLEKRARKVNRHYSALAVEYADLGGQLNSFSLDSHGQFDKFAPAVEKVGQAVDQGYISTTHLVDRLSVEFSEPLAESVQLAATARQILKYRRQRELQVQIVKDALSRQTAQLEQLQKAEAEAERMNSYLHADDRIKAATQGLADDRDHVVDQHGIHDHDHEIMDDVGKDGLANSAGDDSNESHDTSHDLSGDVPNTSVNVSAHDEGSRGSAEASDDESDLDSVGDEDTEGLVPTHTPEAATAKASGAGLRRGFKLPGLSHINHAIHGMMDVDPQTARRNNITRTQERIQQLTAALEVAQVDAEVAAREVSAEIQRYNTAKHDDIRKLVKAFVRCHIEWAEKNLESWIEAKQAIANS